MNIEISVCRFENLFLPDIGYSRISAVVTHEGVKFSVSMGKNLL